jgi:hypothetical protein
MARQRMLANFTDRVQVPKILQEILVLAKGLVEGSDQRRFADSVDPNRQASR